MLSKYIICKSMSKSLNFANSNILTTTLFVLRPMVRRYGRLKFCFCCCPHPHFQLHFMGELARRADTDVVKNCVFQPGYLRPRVFQGPRKVGRPKDIWTTKVFREATIAAGSTERLTELWQDTPAAKSAWRVACRLHVSHTNA